MPRITAQNLHDADLTSALVNRHRHGVDDVDSRHQQRDRRNAAENHLAVHDLLLHFLALLVHRVGVREPQVMDGCFNVGDIAQVIDLDIDLVVALALFLGLGHVIVDLLQHLHVLDAQHDTALGPVALGPVRLQNAHNLQFPAAALFGGAFASLDGQGHLVLVDVHKGRQFFTVGRR